MAKQRPKFVNTGTIESQSFDEGLNEDIKDFHLSKKSWTQARNAINNSQVGDLGDIGNEPSNKFCTEAPYTIIGGIHLEADKWAIFSTNNIGSEIGIFEEGTCSYTRVVNDPCLNFSKIHLIKGAARELHDCTFQIYWDDGENPTRTMNLENVPWIQNCSVIDGCQICEDTTQLDCDKIRLAPFVKTPCVHIKKGASGGGLLNGSYYIVIGYTINQQLIGDYSIPSNVQGLFFHENATGSIDIEIESMDPDFEEFELVLVSIVNQETSARRVGYYSTRQTRITIDAIDNRWPSIPIENIPLRRPVIDKSDALYSAGEYLLRVGPTSKFDFNYQPLANQIGTKWVSVEYPADYYRKGGNNTGYMRDEVYPFFIRWIYDTGDKSPSFHIPGRAANTTDFDIISSADAEPEVSQGITSYRWIVQNTASITSIATIPQDDGGVQVAEGLMGYWESTEFYDDDKPQIWNADIMGHSEWDLCGKPIRHHRFPDNITGGSDITNHYSSGGENIRVLGVKFENIQPPVDNDGNPITNVVGYEILRGSREGNKTVIAKGMINNMFKYDIEGGITNRQGLYPNYPYNDLGADPYLSQTDVSYEPLNGGSNPQGLLNYNPITEYSQGHFTFHSPDTQYKNPFLSPSEIKIYGQLVGTTEGHFAFPDKHPKHKFVTDYVFWASIIGGIGLAMIALNGKRTTKVLSAQTINLGGSGIAPAIGGLFAQPGVAGVPDFNAAGLTAVNTAYGTVVLPLEQGYGSITLGSNFIGLDNVAFYGGIQAANAALSAAPGVIGPRREYTQESGIYGEVPTIMAALQALPTFSYYFTEGVDSIINAIKAFSPYRQHALQYLSHCLYDEFIPPQVNNNRRVVNLASYLDGQIQDFGTGHRINNLFRGRCVALETSPIADAVGDNSKVTLTTAPVTYDDPLVPFNRQAGSHYVALKERIRNQYGQIENIIQVPASSCTIPTSDSTSPIIFGGDIYIGRHTEKNTKFFFTQWLYDQLDGSEFNYHLNQMHPYSAYWMDTESFDFNEFINSFGAAFANISSFFSTIVTPSDKHCFDRNPSGGGFFTVRDAYMYLFNSGVRDFFVESEVNVEYRDWGDNDAQRHYDWERYTDLNSLFNTGIIKSGNYFKYDYSLSISRLFNNYISWGNTHLRSYDPLIAEQCYNYRPDRVYYSLPQQLENIKDYWRVFLPNNYRDFKSRITSIKTVNKSGIMFLFENESPVQFLGVDQLQTDAGTKITIGDGGLFNQPLQNLLNSDRPYEYGSCQNRLSVVNTPAGIFWISQNQGKIFQLSNGIKEISMRDLKWWFANYLPYKLLKQFPDFELTDNPVIGIGCQAIYDNLNQLVYFCKRDFVLRDDIVDVVTYVSEDDFLVNGILPIKLGDSRYFKSASWTVSYDPKAEEWISYHDWHPNLLLPGKNTFMSILNNGIWIHNLRCDSYCNFYGVDYPFEVEYTINTVQTVNALRSVEYQLEAYKFAENCFDRYHVLDFNFDEATVYNSEQCSGLLRLNPLPKNDLQTELQYPIIGPTAINILYSKEEQRYRFNQFWDITDDRGEFSTAERMIWNTEPNGYVRVLNPTNLNYNKSQLQRKKFRHYENAVLLRRRISGNRKMIVILSNNKNLVSPR